MKKLLPVSRGWKTRLTTFSAVFLCLLLVQFNAFAQNCANIDFSFGNFTNWVGWTGTPGVDGGGCCPILTPTQGIVPGRHTVIGPAPPYTTIPSTNNLLQVPLAPYPYCAQLGNSNTGAEAEMLTYDFVVTPQTALLIYDFAVVLEDPSHPVSDQPRFEFQVTDITNGGNVVPCTYYNVAAGQGIPGFQVGVGGVVWRDWTRVGVDLTSSMGNTVRIEAKVGDCSQSGHYGYAFLRAECQPLQIVVEYCLGDTVANMTAPDGFVSYQWYDQNGPIPNATSQTHSVNNPNGNYQVQITSATGCTATLSTILSPVSVTANFNQGISCDGGVNFNDLSVGVNGNVWKWAWDFGDGSPIDSTQNPFHSYQAYGTYTVTLLAWAQGCSEPDTFTAQITTPPVITPNFTSPVICALNQQFTDASTILPVGTINGWSWNFGDGGNSTAQNPTHTYTASGTYNVELTVTDNNGCQDSITIPVLVGPIPTANFTFTSDCQYDALPFVDASTPYAGGTITGYQWNFGDGSPATNTQSPNHQFPGDGTFNVQLVVTGSQGCTDTVTLPVIVYPVPVANFLPGPGCVNEVTNILNTSTINNPDNINSVMWTFNPPQPFQTTYDATPVFTQYGPNQVTLVVNSNHGCLDTITLPVNVGATPEVAFIGDIIAGCEDHLVNFTNNSTVPTGVIDSVTWDFGDGGNAVFFNIDHTFTNPGTYNISLTVYSAGCDSTLIIPNYITVYALPVAGFSFTNQCDGVPITFNNETTILPPATAPDNDWTFTGVNVPYNNSSNTISPSVNPNVPGTYNAQLIVTSDEGCLDTLEQLFEVYENPTANFVFLPSCYNVTTMIDSSYGGSGNLALAWDVLDNGSGVDGDYTPFSYIFNGGNGLVNLQVTDANGCTGDTAKVVDLKPAPPSPGIPNVIVVGNTNGNEKFDFEVFAPGFNECIDYTFSVFNRWGIKVFETTNDHQLPDLNCVDCFRGLTEAGSTLTPGTYYWVLQGQPTNVNMNGTITLVHAQ